MAWISLVFFTMRNMRLPWLPDLTRHMLRPMSNHQFLNVRTYVKHIGEPGIYFLHEWLNNRLSVLLGAATFGLPYHYARIETDQVECDGKRLMIARQPAMRPLQPAAVGTLDTFLLERYTAFTQWRGIRRCFRIRHEPWPQRRLKVTMQDAELVERLPFWPVEAQVAMAHESPGVMNVEISRPYVIG